MRTLTISFAVVALYLALLADAASGQDDAAAMEGVWKPTSARRGIQNIGDHILAQENWTIRDGSYYVLDRRDRSARVQIKLDPSATPKEIDVIVTEGIDAGKHDRGIYELQGDKLTVCWGLGSTRPKRLEWKADDRSLYLVVYERVVVKTASVLSQ